MPKLIEHNMSATAAATTGRTLDYAAPIYDWLAPLMVFGFEQRCGGLVLEQLDGQAGGHVDGVDAAERMLDVARRKTPEGMPVRFEAALAEELPYPDHTFDRAVSTFFFHHIEFDLKVRALTEMWRTLKPGGVAVVVDVDIPTTWMGKVSAWSGYRLFHQEAIRENIEGRLRDAFDASPFRVWQLISHHSGYMSVFKLMR
jgi:ubiquinone/menaquinone biosynthesis C-methylase UbiE